MSLAQPLSRPLERLAQRLAARPPAEVTDPGLIWAAVAVVLADRAEPGGPVLLLIRRAERAGDPWSGHMGLPGGRRDPGDPDLLTTAIREVLEEVGVRLAPEHLLGTLDDVAPRTPVLPPVAVRPFVFALPEPPPLQPNAEIAAAGWVALPELLDPRTRRTVQVEVRGESRLVSAFVTDAGIVWGMTERILSLLLVEAC
jgi:8-oxo-dGTP pyrophosphatase MutT (NUDIX family)